MWSLRQERSPAIYATVPPHDGLCVPRVEVHYTHPCPEAAGVTIQVSSPCYWCPWYVSNRLIHEDLGIPLFADHIRALNAIFDSKLADVGNPLLRQIGRYLGWPRVDPFAWRVSEGRQGPAGQSRPSPAMAKSTKTNRVQRWSAERLSSTLTEVFRDFFSCKANARE